jgi:hypothetical protein
MKTAVEWLYEKILLTPLDIREINKCLEQAKEMEKQQIYRACAYYFLEDGKLTPTQYYNETFKSE